MVYVDDLAMETTVNHKTAKWCRLTADTKAELDEMAVEMRLDMRFFCPVMPGCAYTIAATGIRIERDTYLITKSAASHAIEICGVQPVTHASRPWR